MIFFFLFIFSFGCEIACGKLIAKLRNYFASIAGTNQQSPNKQNNKHCRVMANGPLQKKEVINGNVCAKEAPLKSACMYI